MRLPCWLKEFASGEEEQAEDSFSVLSQYQLLSFLQWCDKKDWEDIFEKPSIFEWQRLCYLALAVGYRKLALLFASLIDEQMIQESRDVLEKYGNKIRLLEKKWVVDFYRKQPDGKKKKKLAKRIMRYGRQLFVEMPEKRMV